MPSAQLVGLLEQLFHVCLALRVASCFFLWRKLMLGHSTNHVPTLCRCAGRQRARSEQQFMLREQVAAPMWSEQAERQTGHRDCVPHLRALVFDIL